MIKILDFFKKLPGTLWDLLPSFGVLFAILCWTVLFLKAILNLEN